jgi:hypothetical protein
MKFGICLLSIIPVRAEANDRSEMTTQLLFGDLVVIEEVENNWFKIRIVFDNYEGWVDRKQIVMLEEDEFHELSHLPARYSTDIVEIVNCVDQNSFMPILFGASIRKINNKGYFQLAGSPFKYEGGLTNPDQQLSRNSILENAMTYLNAPYLWGGKSPFGIDCSGFTQMVFKVSGVRLLRDASQQAGQGDTINFIDEAQAGDLIFFDDDEGNIIHVGIMYHDQKIIHASGKVRLDSIDHQGIFNWDLKKYTHKLRLIKRIL